MESIHKKNATAATAPIVPLDLLGFVRRKTGTTILLGGLLLLILVPLAFWKGKPVYEAEGRLILWPEVRPHLTREPQRLPDLFGYTATDVQRLEGPVLVANALKSLPRENWPIFIRDVPDVDYAARLLIPELEVENLAQTHLILVRLHGSEAKGLAETVNAIMDRFIAVLEEQQRLDSQKRLPDILAEKDAFIEQLAKLRERKLQIADKAFFYDFKVGAINPYDEVLKLAQTQYQTALSASMERKTALDAAQQNYEKVIAVLSPNSMDAYAAKKLMMEAESALQSSAGYVEESRQGLERARQLYAENSRLVSEGDNINTQMTELNLRLAQVEDRIREVQMESKTSVHAGIEQRAETPGKPVKNTLVKYLAVAMIGAFGAAGASLLGLEHLRNRVRSPFDVAWALGGMPAPPIPHFPSRQATELVLGVKTHPEHPCSVAVRKLAVRLNRERLRGPGNVFLMTGTESGSGVSWVTRNMGEALAPYCQRVLVLSLPSQVVEAEPHAGFDEELYLKKVMPQIWNFEEGMAFHAIPPQAPILQRRGLFAKFLERSHSADTMILVDAPPVMDHDLVQFLAPFTQGMVVITREQQSSYARLRGTLDLATHLGVPSLTAVLNGWRDGAAAVESRQKSKQGAVNPWAEGVSAASTALL